MNKSTNGVVRLEETRMRTQYDFRRGVRGKHFKAMQAGLYHYYP